MKLTEKQRRFANEYIKTGNATQSAINAGYSVKTAGVVGNENLKKPNIKAFVDKRLKEIEDKSIMSQTEALQTLTRIARGEIKEPTLIFVGEGVQEVTELPTHPNTIQRAAESLLKRYDLIPKDKIQIKKTELEIQKLEKELQSEETTEDKLSQLIDSVDKQAGDE